MRNKRKSSRKGSRKGSRKMNKTNKISGGREDFYNTRPQSVFNRVKNFFGRSNTVSSERPRPEPNRHSSKVARGIIPSISNLGNRSEEVYHASSNYKPSFSNVVITKNNMTKTRKNMNEKQEAKKAAQIEKHQKRINESRTHARNGRISYKTQPSGNLTESGVSPERMDEITDMAVRTEKNNKPITTYQWYDYRNGQR